jgi:hypothetical protein
MTEPQLQKVYYHAARDDGRKAGIVVYPGVIIADGKKTKDGELDFSDPKNVRNHTTFSVEPGLNQLNENQIKVLKAIPNVADKIARQLVDLDPSEESYYKQEFVPEKRHPLKSSLGGDGTETNLEGFVVSKGL